MPNKMPLKASIKEKSEKTPRKSFSKFTPIEAFKQLQITELIPWSIPDRSISPSAYFQQRLANLTKYFDLQGYEEGKKLLVDAICEEAISGFERLKIWKGAALESNIANGNVDYLIAERKAYLEAPLLCIIEAKKDDFEKGLAQCLVEMQACQYQNHQIGKNIDILGIVTNGEGWKFYKLTPQGKVYETLTRAIADIDKILGELHHVFEICEQNLD